MGAWGVVAAVGATLVVVGASGVGLLFLIGETIYNAETTDDGTFIE